MCTDPKALQVRREQCAVLPEVGRYPAWLARSLCLNDTSDLRWLGEAARIHHYTGERRILHDFGKGLRLLLGSLRAPEASIHHESADVRRTEVVCQVLPAG